MRKAIVAIALFLALLSTVSAQGPIYFPMILKEPTMPDTTVALVTPAERFNDILNPSGETTGNFSLQGGSTVNRVTTFQKYGVYSYQLITAGNATGINLTTSALSASPYYVTFRIINSKPVRLNVTVGSTTKEAKFLEKIDPLWDLYGVIFTATQASTATNVRITQIGAGVNTLYIDGVQAEYSTGIEVTYTSYIDGTQLHCIWAGTPHASRSQRVGTSKQGGYAQDLFKGYGFFLKRVIGAGVVTPQLNIDSYAILPGGEVNSEKIPPRQITLVGEFYGDNEEDLHAKQQALELALASETVPTNQPNLLRFYKAEVQKELKANYTGGLEGDLPVYYNELQPGDANWTKIYKYLMPASIQLTATDPFFYEVGESSTILDTNDSATFRVVAARLKSTGQWSALGPPGTGGSAAYVSVRAIAEDANYIYMGGSFTNFNGIAAADNIVRYEKSTGTYTALGSAGPNGVVYALAIGPDGLLYVGGDYTTVGGGASLRISTWNPTTSTWAQLGAGLNGLVYALAFGLDGTLYIGGLFTNVAAGTDDYIVSWTTAGAYVAIGSASPAGVTTLAVAPDGIVYAGGTFTAIGASSADYVAAYDPSTGLWSALGNVALDNPVNALAVSPNGTLYIGGDFTNAGMQYLAQWNGTYLSAVGSGLSSSGFVNSLAVGPDGIVYIGGQFSSAGGILIADRITRWNGYSYSHLDIDQPGTPTVFSILSSKYVDPVVGRNYDLYLGHNTSGTGNFAGKVTVTNQGTFPAFPSIVISRTGGTGAIIQSIRNETTGRQLLLDYILLDGETLTINLQPKNRTVISSMFGNREDAILPSDKSIWQLLPGSNNVTAFVSESGSPTITAYALWRDAYKSWN